MVTLRLQRAATESSCSTEIKRDKRDAARDNTGTARYKDRDKTGTSTDKKGTGRDSQGQNRDRGIIGQTPTKSPNHDLVDLNFNFC